MLVFVLFELTIVVDSVSFSWDLGPCCFCVSLYLAFGNSSYVEMSDPPLKIS